MGHIIGVPGKNVVSEILSKYKQQMKFVDIDDEKNWWRDKPVQRKPLNIYREDAGSDLEITSSTGPKKAKKEGQSQDVKLIPGAVKGYAVEKTKKADKKAKKDKKKKKKK